MVDYRNVVTQPNSARRCQINNIGACCCTCRHRILDYSHPITDGKPAGQVRGYICNHPELGAYSGWPAHGMCECHQPVETEMAA